MTYIPSIAGSPQIEHALRSASQRTGADFDYLLKTAVRESNLKTNAKSKTSSATGLFQFIEQTWLGTLKKSGGQYGLGHLSNSIEARSDGTYKVANPATRSAILALRDDPKVSALMAGAYTKESAASLQSAFGRAPKQGELYIAHFMGKNGAIDLISMAGRNPKAIAAHHFPKAAAANKNIFYTSAGRPKTVMGVYQNLMSKHGAKPVQVAHLNSASVHKRIALEGDAEGLEFSPAKHLASHFKSSGKRGGFSDFFGGGVKKASPAKTQSLALVNEAVSVMHKTPTQLLSDTLVQKMASQDAKLHLASAGINAYQKQQMGAKVHNLFASPGLRGAFR